ncbi:Outer membrane lipoprotein-sorting protein [Singulisphaera sp. GP187]|uniref:LolA family protein n=1 Tax=Singulisphaera sp. GP187 TaxID=1882752 RepID=UPI00092934D6|nr:hypothetical protein [Singulisphaera sp. GP187]SIO56293.1 Outer membrane lipoprotein-sorting protein [Singulisphaera sp. GP187]
MVTPQDQFDRFEPEEQALHALFQRTAPEVTPTDIEALFAKSKTSRTRPQRVFSRRLVMTIRITVGTIIAAGVAALISLLVPSQTTAALNLADVQREVKATRTVTFTSNFVVNGESKHVTKHLILPPDRLRFETENGYTVIDFKTRKGMSVNTKDKTVEFSDTGQNPSQKNLYSLFRDLTKTLAEPLPAREIDGKHALGFVAALHGHEVSIWVDPETRLPIRVEQTHKEGGFTMETVTKDIVFDRPLDDSLFRLTAPAGYRAPLSNTPFKITFLAGSKLLPAPDDPSLAAPQVTPLSGIGTAQFGMTKEQILKLLGKPDREFIHGRSTYLSYSSRGFELAFLPPDHPRHGLSHVACLNEQAGPIQPIRKFNGKTDKGIGLGASQADVIKAYGPPDEAGAPRKNEVLGEEPHPTETPMDHVTIDYKGLGLSFDFFKDKVHRISIDAPGQAPAAK